MNIEQLREYCLQKPSVEESFPFDEETLVFKVGNKMFALIGIDEVENPSVNLKGDPEKNIEMREEYEGVKPGFHMNKKHWNTVSLESDIRDVTIKEFIDISYSLVVNSLTKKLRTELNLI